MGSTSPDPIRKTKPVVVVGGGISGLAAAVGLTSRYIPVVLLEQKPLLGGRAYSFKDATTGDIIDNGQHVLIAGYERTMRFLETIGSRDLVTVQGKPTLLFHHPEKGFREFSLPKLPAPLHLLAGFLSTGLFSIADRARLLRAGWAILHGRESAAFASRTIDEWLNSVGQSVETKRSFWEPLAISIMNERIEHAAAAPFVTALRHAFLKDWRSASLVIPRAGLTTVYVDAAQKHIILHGGRIHTGADVVELTLEGSRVAGVRLRDNMMVECSALILAVPYYRLADILRDDMISSPASSLDSSPIVSIHLWFDRDFMEQEVVGLIERRIQWVFNRRRICDEHGKGGYISAVISAAHSFVSKTNEELVQIAMADLRGVYESLLPEPSHAVVIREKRATFSSSPAAEKLRPSQQTSVPNLFLAGDWTDTGFPATIEGSVISAERCVELAARVLHLV